MDEHRTLIIGVSGKMGTGKNYIAEHIIIPFLRKHYKQHSIIEMAFADQIKVNAMVKHGLTIEALTNKTARIRNILQKEGTEEGRDKLGEDVWVNYLSKWIDLHQSRGVKVVVITDVRFKNEAEFIKKRGGQVIRIEAPQRNTERLVMEHNTANIKMHRSETELDDFKGFDLVVNNDLGTNEKKTSKIIRDFLSSNT